MSSVLTNNGAMVALQTLKGINKAMAKTQDAISTGKDIATAKDNAAVWAISKVMESDVKGFKAIGDSLALGESTVAVARNASEKVTGLLQDIKAKIVAAQESNVDRAKIQDGISALRDQINTIVNSAQFNGLNLVKGTDDVSVLSSLDRSENGTVSSSSITVKRNDLSSRAGEYGDGTGTDLTANGTVSAATLSKTAREGDITGITAIDAGDAGDVVNFNFNIAGKSLSFSISAENAVSDADVTSRIAAEINGMGLEGITADGSTAGKVTVKSTRAFEDVKVTASSSPTGSATGGAVVQPSDDIAARAESIEFEATAVTSGDGYKVTIGASEFTYVAGKGETMEDVVKGLRTAIDAGNVEKVKTSVSYDSDSGKWSLKVDNDGGDLAFSFEGTSGGEASGGLFGLDSIDVTKNPANALNMIETMIQSSIDASASFGSVQSRIGIQADFIGEMMDSLRSGIGAMVDANMEETSARLQALQVQQQLGVQSLSIANQAPQMLLALFR